ncbi:MAG: aldehyde dehydrogenase [Erysipelotrichaceae bacterium]|nr:aldehyde dehydrogenase [Erysipelotrichaceae bacterium]
MDIKDIVDNQRIYFYTNETKDINTRIKTLKKIRQWIKDNEAEILGALKADLNKGEVESYMCEVGLTLSELNYQLRHIKHWSKKHYTWTPLAQFYGTSFEYAQPYGVTLIMSPWNYPFMLSMEPAIGAIAAGNCVIIKPSAYAPHVSHVIYKLVNETCDPKYVCVVEGGREENTALLEQRFDYIFFTGSVNVGHLVMEKASKYLTPVTLELGGKSPCIVDDGKSLKLAAKRIAWGKFLNAGQTCVAPDYLLIREELKDNFVGYMKKVIHEFFGENPIEHEQLVKIINQKHFDRLNHLLENQDILCGGNSNPSTLKIAPTLVSINDANNPLMQEEIFGPILPIITYNSIDEVIEFVNSREKPLAFYIFSSNRNIQNKLLQSCSFGGGCINDTIIHLATSKLGFGGVGNSGMGSYHGKKSFDTFSHTHSIVKKARWIDLPMRYYPLNDLKDKLIRMFVR